MEVPISPTSPDREHWLTMDLGDIGQVLMQYLRLVHYYAKVSFIA